MSETSLPPIALLLLLAAGCASANRNPEYARTEWPATPVAPAPEVPRLAEHPPLTELLQLALERNPRILAARERAIAAAESPAVDGALPDPSLMLGWYATPVETRVGPQQWSLALSQKIPFPSKLTARGDIARADARRARVAYERVVRDVLVEVVRTAHELRYVETALEISKSIQPLVERYVAAAAQGAPTHDLLRAETQRAQLQNDRVLLAELRAVESETLLSLLDLPPGTPLGAPRIGETPDVDARFEELLAVAEEHNQELKEAGIAAEAAGLRATLARRERLPDFTVGYSHIFTDGLGGAVTPADNGKDAQIVYFGLTLPLWASKNSARVRRAQARERAAVRDRIEARLGLRKRLARAWYHVGNSGRLVRLYRDVLVPRAEAAARTAEDLAAAGKGDLIGAVETIAVLHNFRLAEARARADLGQSVAELEAILGRPLEGRRQ